MNKSIVFISHITEEKEIALAFKNLIENSFLGMIDVFVSSDENSISTGQRRLDNITTALKECSIEIVLCSPKSVSRPWINFEAGAAWVRDISVIPLCHSGMKPSSLPIPLNLLQAASASEIASLRLIFPVLARAIGSQVPKVDFSNFIEAVKDFEERYTFWDEVNKIFREVHLWNNTVLDLLKKDKIISCNLTETDINLWKHWSSRLKNKNILDFRVIGGANFTPTGTFYGCEILALIELEQVTNDTKFNCKNQISIT